MEDWILDMREEVLTSHERPNVGHTVEVLICYGGLDVKYMNGSPNRSKRTRCLTMVNSW